ncbi:MAG: class I SAM-dependent methyltransferase [Halanaerobium sp.]
MLQKVLLKKIFNQIEGYIFGVTYWDGEKDVFGGTAQNKNLDFEIIFNKKLDLKKIKESPQLRLGEAYMDGDIDIKGDLRDVLQAGAKNISRFNDKGAVKDYDGFMRRQRELSKHEQEDGVRYHYDLGNDFFQLWQDETMTYSCAYFKSRDDSLEDAQIQKIDHILNKLNLSPGETLLDIGCGWGELAIRAAEKYNADVLGITISPEQVKGAAEKKQARNLKGKVEFKKLDYRDLAKEDMTFDKVISVGMFEHVGKEHIPEYFKTVNKLLKDGGLSLLHTITHQKEDPTHPWLEKYIFPWGYIPSYREVVWELPEHSFSLIDAENIRRHYALTAERWADNYAASRDEVVDKFDEKFARMWELFLAGVVAAFRYLNTSVHQFLFVKGYNNERPLTRDYMYK